MKCEYPGCKAIASGLVEVKTPKAIYWQRRNPRPMCTSHVSAFKAMSGDFLVRPLHHTEDPESVSW